MLKLPVVGVMGWGGGHTPEAALVGNLLGRLGVHLLTGGGFGQMTEVARAFVGCPQRKGQSIGVIPCYPGDPTRPKTPDYPNPFVEIAIHTHLAASSTDPLSRNHINILSSEVVVVLFGSSGTLSEVTLARRYGKPCCLFLLPETRREKDCSLLVEEFEESNILETLERLESWLRSGIAALP